MPNIALGKFENDKFSFQQLPIFIYSGHAFNDPNFYFPQHKHDKYSEIIFIKDGEGSCVINGRQYESQKGDILIFNRGILHEERSSAEKPLDFYYCAVGNLSIRGVPEGCVIPNDIEPIIHACDHAAEIEFFIKSMFEECTVQNIGYMSLCQSFMISLIVLILRIINEQCNLITDEKENSIASRVIEYIDRNYSRDITLSDLAQTMFISQHYLSHVFKDETGYSPINYLIRRRMDEAKKLLLNSARTIQEISNIVGYADANHFDIVFKRINGMTPSKYRDTISK